MGVIVFIMILSSVIFIIISLSILSLQTSTSALDSVNDYQILYLLGKQEKAKSLYSFATDSKLFLGSAGHRRSASILP